MLEPGIYGWYPSGAVSKYWCWFYDLGYPELDILEDENSKEWHLIQYYNSPIVPSLTKWQIVLGPMRNVIPSYSFCQKYANELDITKKVFWAREDAKTKASYEEGERSEKRALDFTKQMTKAVMKDDALKERIIKNGAKELDIRQLAMNVPKHEVIKPAFKGDKVDVPNSSQPAIKTVHEGTSGKVHG
jgi:hypothetical protein